MATVPNQYLAGSPTQDAGNLSPLQLALAYFMDLGQQVPFAVNTDFIYALKTFSNSGVVTPSDLNLENVGNVSVISDGPWVKIIRRAENCGPLEIERYDSVIVGSKADLLPKAWTFDAATVRGGSLSTGGGGPWGSGGLSSAFPGPCNAEERPPPIVSDYGSSYGSPESVPQSPDVFFEGWAPPSDHVGDSNFGAASDPEGTADASRGSGGSDFGASSDPEGTADASRGDGPG